jgi:hypothetical protein
VYKKRQAPHHMIWMQHVVTLSAELNHGISGTRCEGGELLINRGAKK